MSITPEQWFNKLIHSLEDAYLAAHRLEREFLPSPTGSGDLTHRILSSTVSREEQVYQAGWNEATAPDAQDEALEEETPEPFRCEGVHDHPGHEWVDDRDGLTYWCRGQDSTDVPPAEGQSTFAHLNDGDVIKAKEPLTLKPADGPETASDDDVMFLLGLVIWMSGSDDFSPGGKAGAEWERKRERVYEILGRYPQRPADSNSHD